MNPLGISFKPSDDQVQKIFECFNDEMRSDSHSSSVRSIINPSMQRDLV